MFGSHAASRAERLVRVLALNVALIAAALSLVGCGTAASSVEPVATTAASPAATAESAASTPTVGETNPAPVATSPAVTVAIDEAANLARVLDVSASGDPGSYTFAVTVESPDSGCDRYADWWEVITSDGGLLYRRTLLHSHVGEQPFTRTGGPVSTQANDEVIVRVHMYPDGYATSSQQGSVSDGFVSVELEMGFASELEGVDPQPPPCAA